jgi:hypothetical protein
MNTKRKLAEEVLGWLIFEFHNFRGQLFGEKYLTTLIGHILSGIYGNRVMTRRFEVAAHKLERMTRRQVLKRYMFKHI